MFCKVVFDVPLDRDFDYHIPLELESQVQPGVRVTAPFGHLLTGGLVTQVTEISGAPEGVKLKDIVHVLDERPLFGSDLFPLAKFIKSRFGGPIGQILFALVPPQPYFKLEHGVSAISIDIKTPPFKLTSAQKQTLDEITSFAAYEFCPGFAFGRRLT